jgi:hypothetical protein
MLLVPYNVTVSDVYHWQRPELVKRCSDWKLSPEGSVQELRERLTAYIRPCSFVEMETKPESVATGSAEVCILNYHRD